MRRVNLLLIAWCALLLAPAALSAAGVFGRYGHGTTLGGPLAGAWIVGYLAQFFVFMALMQTVGEQKILWWLVASLLPWVSDWATAASSQYLALSFAATVAVAWWIARVAVATRFMAEHGLRASGEVIEVLEPLMNVVINRVYIRRTVRLRIVRDDGAPAYEARLKGLFMLGEVPKPGDKLRLLVDPNRPQHLVPDSTKPTPSSSSHSHESATRTHTPAPPSTWLPPSESPHPSHAAPSNLAEELEKLAKLHDRGVLDAREFAAAKKKLLGD
jgi:hypothetical protein